jgi:tetratricopeptide (TPR) repeat protein
MKTAITLTGLAIFLCACASSHKTSTASVQGLTPQQADQMEKEHAVVKEAKAPPVTAATRFALGQVAESQGDYDAAIHQYHRALELDANHLPSLCRLGAIYAEQKNYNLSIETWNRYIAASGDAAWAYANLGYCYELAGYPTLAKQTYLKGIAKDPKNAPCRTNYGIMLARDGKIADALRMWNPVLTDAQMHYNLASLYQKDGRKTEAKAEFQKALDSDPSLIDARARLAQMDIDRY